MGASCSSSASSSGPSSVSQPYRCLRHTHRPASSSAPYPKSPLARLHSHTPPAPSPVLNGLLRLKQSALRLDSALTAAGRSHGNSVTPIPSATAHAHLYVNVVAGGVERESIEELMCRTPVGSFAFYVDLPLSTEGVLTLPLHIAYHYQPRPHCPPAASSASVRSAVHTFVHSASLDLHVTLTPNASPTANARHGGRQWQATCSGRSYQRLQRLSSVFLPRLRRFLLDATTHPAFRVDSAQEQGEECISAQPDETDDEPPTALPSSVPLPTALPFSLSSFTDRQRTGLLLSLSAPSTAASSHAQPQPPPHTYHVDVEWRHDSPQLHCRELGTLVDCDHSDHSLACLLVRAHIHSQQPGSGGGGGELAWRRLYLDIFSAFAPQALASDSRLKIAALLKGTHSHDCCSTTADFFTPVNQPPVPALHTALDRRFLVLFLREYAFHYAGSTMLDTVVATQAAQTLLTPKRGSQVTFGGQAMAEAADGGDERLQRQSVQELLVSVMEAVRGSVAADASPASRLQWCAAVGLPLLEVLCLHPRHVRLQQLGLAILELLSERAECLLPLQRSIFVHLARHATCQGVLEALLSLVSSSASFSAALKTEGWISSLLVAAQLFHCALLPAAALVQPELPALPPVTREVASSMSTDSALFASHQSSPSQSVEFTPSPRRAPLAAASGRVPSNSTAADPALQPLQSSFRQRSASSHIQKQLASPPKQQQLLSATAALPSPTAALTTRSVSFHHLTEASREEAAEDERRDAALERRGILKASPLPRARESGRKAEEEKEREEESGESRDAAASTFQRAGGSLARSSRMRASSMRRDTAVEEKQQLDSDKPAELTFSAGAPSFVIPKLKLALALGSTTASTTTTAIAPLASMRYTRRASRRSDATSRHLHVDRGAEPQTWHMLSPSSLPMPPALTLSNRSTSTPLVTGSHRFSVLDPELAMSGPALSASFRGESDAEARESLRKLRELAVGAGECCVTSQLSSVLWHKKQFTPHDLSLLGWTAGAQAGKLLEEPVDGWKRKDRTSASHFSPPPLRSQTSLYLTSDPLSGRQKTETEGHTPELQLLYCAALTLRCLHALLAATAQHADGQQALTRLSSQLAALVRVRSMKDERCAILRLPGRYLTFYQQLVLSTMHAVCLPTPLPPSHRLLPTASLPYWRVCLPSSHAPARVVPLLHSLGLELRFARSFASLDAICLLPPALLSPSRTALTSTQLFAHPPPSAKPLMLLPSSTDFDRAHTPAGEAVVVARCESDVFYERSAETLEELVESLSRMQFSTPHRHALAVLQHTADTLQALHHYTIQPRCAAGVATSFATSASVLDGSTPESQPASGGTRSAADWSCPCGNSISLLLHTCGAPLIDLHGQLSRLYKVCKQQAADVNSRLPVAPVTLAASMLEVQRLCAVNELIALWTAVLSHPSSHATHVLLVRLLRDATSLLDDSSHEQLRFGDSDEVGADRADGARSKRTRHMHGARRSVAAEQKVALFSVYQFVHDHGLLVFASSASTYCLFAPLTTPALARRATGEPSLHSARLSLATTLLQRTLSSTYRQTSQPSSAHSHASLDDEDEEATVPAALHPAVHRCRVLVLDFYTAVGVLLSRVGSSSVQAAGGAGDKVQQPGSTREEAEPSKPAGQSSAHSAVSSRDMTDEEEDEDDEDEGDYPADEDSDDEQDAGARQRDEDDASTEQRQARRRNRQRQTDGGESKQGPTSVGASTQRAASASSSELAWYWSTLAEVLHPPHGVIARFFQLTANIDGQRTAEEVRDEDDSDSDEDGDETSSNADSSTSLSASHSNDSPRGRSTKFPSTRLRELDLLSAQSRLWCTALEWQDGSASRAGSGSSVTAHCPWLLDDKLLDGTVRFHFIHFIRLYHHSAGLDAVRAQCAALHLHVLTSAACSSSLLLRSTRPGDIAAEWEEEEGGERRNGSFGSSAPSAKRGVVDQVSASMLRLRVLHFLSHELSAEHEAFVTRSYLNTAPAASTAAPSSVANSARSLAAFSPANSRLSSTLNSPMGRASANSTPLQPIHQLATLDLTEANRRPPLHTLASPAFNLLKAMSSSATLQAAANREPEKGGLSTRVNKLALTPLTLTPNTDSTSTAGARSHRRTLSSPVQGSPEAPLVKPTPQLPFQRSMDPSPRTPLCTHPEEETEEQSSESSDAQPRATHDDETPQGTEEERGQEVDDEEDEDDTEEGAAAAEEAELEEESAMRREHADDTDPLADELSSKAPSEINSRPVSRSGRAAIASSKRQSFVASAAKRASSSSKQPSERDIEEADEEQGDGGDEEEGDWSYEASDISVSQKPRAAGLQFALAVPASGAEEDEAEGAEGDVDENDDDDDSLDYEASELSAGQVEPSPTSGKPRFALHLAARDSDDKDEPSSTDGAGEEERPVEDGADKDDDELMNGWSDSEPSSNAQRTKRDSTSARGLKLQLLIPAASPSQSTSPSPSESPQHSAEQTADTSSAAAPPRQSLPPLATGLTPPVPSFRVALKLSDHSLSRSPNNAALSNADTPQQHAGSVRDPLDPNWSPSFSKSEVRPFHGRNISMSLVLSPPSPARSLPPPASLAADAPQPAFASFLLEGDALLPGVPEIPRLTIDSGSNSASSISSPFLQQPNKLPISASASQSSHRTSASLGHVLSPLPRFTASPRHRQSSHASVTDDSNGVLATPTPTAHHMPGRLSSMSVSGGKSGKGSSSNEYYNRQRQLRRVYAYPALHASMLRLVLRLLIDPSGVTLSAHYSDRSLQAANEKADADVDVLTQLHSHINHPRNADVVATLVPDGAQQQSSAAPVARLLKLLCESLFPTPMFVSPNSQQIGRGQFAQVYLMRVPHLPHSLAVKQVDMSSTAHQRVVLYDLYTEVAVLERMRRHEGVVQLLDYGVSKGQYYLVMQAADKSLKAWRDEVASKWSPSSSHGKRWAGREVVSPCFNEAQLMLYLYVFRRILRAMRALHSSGIVHFDVKLDNVLLSLPNPSDPTTWQVRLADFGESMCLRDGAAVGSSISRGTENIQSPEMLLLTQHLDAAHHAFDRRRNNVVDGASDVWSVGCLFFELLTNRFLFEAQPSLPIVLRVTGPQSSSSSLLSDADRALLGTFGEKPNRPLLRFLSGVLVQNKDRRPSLAKVEAMFEALVGELFPRGLHVQQAMDAFGSPAIHNGAAQLARRESMLEAAGKREGGKGRSFSMQLDGLHLGVTPLMPLSGSHQLPPLRTMSGAAGREMLSAPSSIAVPTLPTLHNASSRAKRMARFQSSQLSLPTTASPLMWYCTPMPDELRLPFHCVLPALWISARHGRARDVQADAYFGQCGVPATHFVHVTTSHRQQDAQQHGTRGDSDELLTFRGWHALRAPPSFPTPSAPFAAGAFAAESLELLSSPAELDQCVLWVRTAVSLGGRVLLFVDADGSGGVGDAEQDSLRGLCCAFLMAVYGLDWLQAACLVHDKLPVPAVRADERKLTQAMSAASADGAGPSTRRAARESLFRPVVAPASAASSASSSAITTRGSVMLGLGAKQHAAVTQAAQWPARLAASLHAWSEASNIATHPSLSVAFRCFLASLPATSRAQAAPAGPPATLPFALTVATASSYVTFRCLCGSVLVTCPRRLPTRTCCCTAASPSAACPTAPLGCRWHIARLASLYGGQRSSLRWKQLLSLSPSLPLAPSSSLSASSLSSLSSAEPSSNTARLHAAGSGSQSARLRLSQHPLPYSQLSSLQPAKPHTALASRSQLYECKHCLYPMLAAVPPAPARPDSTAEGEAAAAAPVLHFDAGSGTVLLDGRRVQALHVLAELRQAMVDDTAAAATSSSRGASAWGEDGHDGFAYDRRYKALLDHNS